MHESFPNDTLQRDSSFGLVLIGAAAGARGYSRSKKHSRVASRAFVRHLSIIFSGCTNMGQSELPSPFAFSFTFQHRVRRRELTYIYYL